LSSFSARCFQAMSQRQSFPAHRPGADWAARPFRPPQDGFAAANVLVKHALSGVEGAARRNDLSFAFCLTELRGFFKRLCP
jgi:hypothetical protein